MKKIFAHSNWDIIPVMLGIGHLAFNITLYLIYPFTPTWVMIILGFIYSISLSWNINSVSHNFLHNKYFNSRALNYAFSWVESMAIGFSQVFYTWVHMRHHAGNSDLKDENGTTVDWLSIYRHGENGQPESVWGYTFKSFFRDDMGDLYNSIKANNKFKANFGMFEVASFAAMVLIGFYFDWEAILFFVPFYYLGNALSSLNGYYEHLGANPKLPIAWGVSSYNKLYNWIWLNNGYHAEHHYRPKHHWMKMKELREKIKEEQEKAGVHVINYCHALGFLQKRK